MKQLGKRRTIERQVLTITPEMATKILEKNDINRNVRQTYVDRYARDMLDGKWQLNGETIKFAKDGTLIDGQHRLCAVFMAGVPVEFEVVEGLDKSAMMTVDTGRTRSMQDVFQMTRTPNGTALASMLRWWYVYHAGLPNSYHLAVSHAEMIKILDAHPDWVDAIAWALKYKRSVKMVNAGLWSFFHIATMQANPQRAAEFAEQFETGSDLELGSPVLALRERIITMKTTKNRLHIVEVAGLLFKAWNFYVTGKECRKLRIGPSEAFPTLVGL